MKTHGKSKAKTPNPKIKIRIHQQKPPHQKPDAAVVVSGIEVFVYRSESRLTIKGSASSIASVIPW